MTSYLYFAFGLLLLIAPGIGCWNLLFPDDSAAQRIAWGSVLGIAMAVYTAYLCSLGHLSWFYVVWIVPLFSGAACFFWSLRHNEGLSNPTKPPVLSDVAKRAFPPPLMLLPVLLLLTVLQILVVTRHSLPDGWDPSFHLLLAKKIFLSDHVIRDWQPFEKATLNYPIGSHLLIALFAWFSGLPLPLVFQLLMVSFGVLTALAIYALALEYFDSELVGLYAAIAYSFWAFWGSTDYLRWGGLPNQLGMLMGLEILSLLSRGSEQKKSILLIALLFASVCISHNHVMVTMGILLIVLMVFFLATDDLDKRYRTIFFGLSLAAIGAAFFLVPYLMKAKTLMQTRVFEVHNYTHFGEMGLVLVPFALIGIALDYLRKPSGDRTYYLLIATLLLLYVLLGPVHYYYQLYRMGQGYVVFTASRFLSDLIYFVSPFAGYALYRLQEYLGLSTGLTIAVALLLGFTNLPQWEAALAPDADRGRIGAYDWIQHNTPTNSIVMTKEPYASYLAWRRTMLTPMPVSEPRVPPRISDRAKIQLLAGLSPEELRNVELVIVSKPGDRQGGKLLWSNPEGWKVSEVYQRH